jgi:hypothetical protein
MVGNAKQVEAAETNVRKIEQIKLTPWTESIMKPPVAPRSPLVGMIDKCREEIL